MKNFFALFFLLALATPAAWACSPNGMCLNLPPYEGCVTAAQGTKESCNNSAGPFCHALCQGNTACEANCWTSHFSICSTQYCRDLDTCFENICFQN